MPSIVLGLTHTIWNNSMSTTVTIKISCSLIKVGATLAKMLHFDSQTTNNATLASKLNKKYIGNNNSNNNQEVEFASNIVNYKVQYIQKKPSNSVCDSNNNINNKEGLVEIDYFDVTREYNESLRQRAKKLLRRTKQTLGELCESWAILLSFLVFIASDCFLRIFPIIMFYNYLLHVLNEISYLLFALGMVILVAIDYKTVSKMTDNIKMVDKVLFAASGLTSNLLFVIFACQLDFFNTITIIDIKPFFRAQWIHIIISLCFQLIVITWHNVDDRISVYYGEAQLYIVYWIVLAIHVICFMYIIAIFFNDDPNLSNWKYWHQQCLKLRLYCGKRIVKFK